MVDSCPGRDDSSVNNEDVILLSVVIADLEVVLPCSSVAIVDMVEGSSVERSEVVSRMTRVVCTIEDSVFKVVIIVEFGNSLEPISTVVSFSVPVDVSAVTLTVPLLSVIVVAPEVVELPGSVSNVDGDVGS